MTASPPIAAHVEVDPVFALIAAHKAALGEWNRLGDELDELVLKSPWDVRPRVMLSPGLAPQAGGGSPTYICSHEGIDQFYDRRIELERTLKHDAFSMGHILSF